MSRRWSTPTVTMQTATVDLHKEPAFEEMRVPPMLDQG